MSGRVRGLCAAISMTAGKAAVWTDLGHMALARGCTRIARILRETTFTSRDGMRGVGCISGREACSSPERGRREPTRRGGSPRDRGSRGWMSWPKLFKPNASD